MGAPVWFAGGCFKGQGGAVVRNVGSPRSPGPAPAPPLPSHGPTNPVLSVKGAVGKKTWLLLWLLLVMSHRHVQ